MRKGEVLPKTEKIVKFYPNRYAYAERFKIWLEERGIKIVIVEKVLADYGVPEETVKSFFSGKHIPNSHLTALIADIWGYRFRHEDFEERGK